MARDRAGQNDLLARICTELEQRLDELRPLRDEYQRLVDAAATLAAVETQPVTASRSGAARKPPAPSPAAPPIAAAPASRSAELAPATEVEKHAPEQHVLEHRPEERRPEESGSEEPKPEVPKPEEPKPEETGPEEPKPEEPGREEYESEEYEPEPTRAPASPSEVGQAIVAALEHGSHTVSELVMVTAMSPAEIRGGLGRLARRRKVTRIRRPGDGKSAYALPAPAAHR